jgi:hypothetical protein
LRSSSIRISGANNWGGLDDGEQVEAIGTCDHWHERPTATGRSFCHWAKILVCWLDHSERYLVLGRIAIYIVIKSSVNNYLFKMFRILADFGVHKIQGCCFWYLEIVLGSRRNRSGEIAVRFPRLMARIGDWEANDEMTSPEETSQSFSVQSRDEDKILRPRAMTRIAESVRVWAVRTGEMCVPMLEGLSGRLAGKTVSEKSWLDDSRTRDEGKNCNETTLLK